MTYREVVKATRFGGFPSARIEDDGAVDSALLRHWASQANLLHGYKGQSCCFAIPIKYDAEAGLVRYNHGTITVKRDLSGGSEILLAVFDVPLNPFWNKINATVLCSARSDMLVRVGKSSYRYISHGADQVIEFTSVAQPSFDFTTISVSIRNTRFGRYSFTDDTSGTTNLTTGVYTNATLDFPALGGYPWNGYLIIRSENDEINGVSSEVVVTSATSFTFIEPVTPGMPSLLNSSASYEYDLIQKPEMTFHSITIWGEA